MKFQLAGVPRLGRLLAGSRNQSPTETAAPARATGVSRLVESGLFHAEWYSAVSGRDFPDERAALRHYLRRGLARGLMPHPLIEAGALPAVVRERTRAGSIEALLDHLRTPSGVDARLGTLFDGGRSPGTSAAKTEHPGGSLGLFLSQAEASTLLPVPDSHPAVVPDLGTALRVLTRAGAEHERQRRAGRTPLPEPTASVSPEEDHLVALGRGWVDWEAVRAGVGDRDPHLVSVVVSMPQDVGVTIRAVTAVLRDAGTTAVPVEVVVVDRGTRREAGLRLAAVFAAESRVRTVRLPRHLGSAIARNVGFAASRGSVVVMLAHDTEVRSGWLTRLLPRLADSTTRGVQALVLDTLDTIESAGAVFPPGGALPQPFLVGHPPEDAQRMSARPFAAVAGTALALRAVELAELGGFDPAFSSGLADVDYCLRAVRRYGGGFAVESTAWVTRHGGGGPGSSEQTDRSRHLFTARWRTDWPEPDQDRYAELGFELMPSPTQGADAPGTLTRRRTPVPGDDPPLLRWGIRLPSTPGSWGDIWGDTHFADSIARALRRRGQDVVTYRWGSHQSAASRLDDVTLGIRGLEVITPVPGKVNVLWVISHPDLVSPQELDGFDLVFAASVPWAESMSERSGRQVLPLHQALDTEVLPRAGAPVGDGRVPVFVGGSNPPVRDRTSVHALASAGIGLVVHGHGWEGSAVAPFVASTYVAPAEVPTLYRQHGLVIADHWPDMAANGFVANRVFEAVASGARVVSDPVVGIEELFGGAVQVYHSLDELRELCSPAGRVRWPEAPELEDIAARCAQDHSFDRRAAELLDRGVRLWAAARG